jgi:predicted Zn-dependent protease
MARAGYDPVAIARFFELIEKKLGDTGRTSMLSTHPGTPERRQAVLDHAGSLATAGDQPSADQVR